MAGATNRVGAQGPPAGRQIADSSSCESGQVRWLGSGKNVGLLNRLESPLRIIRSRSVEDTSAPSTGGCQSPPVIDFRGGSSGGETKSVAEIDSPVCCGPDGQPTGLLLDFFHRPELVERLHIEVISELRLRPEQYRWDDAQRSTDLDLFAIEVFGKIGNSQAH